MSATRMEVFRRRWRALPYAPVLACLAIAPATAQATTTSAMIVADVPHIAYRDLGAASMQTQIAVAIVLRYRNAAELDQLVALQADPSSPYFRHWLTSSQFDTAFAPTPAAYASVVRSLERAGLRVTQVYANRTVVDAVGKIATVARYFNTRIDRVFQPGYGVRYANVLPARVPASLRDTVYAVTGLHDLNFIRPQIAFVAHHVAKTQPRYDPDSADIYGPISSATGREGYAPVAFWHGYDYPIIHDPRDDGRGNSVANVIDSDIIDADLAGYLAFYHIERKGKTMRVLIDGGPPAGYVQEPSSGVISSDSIEAILDAETLAGAAPGADLYLYEMPYGFGRTNWVTDAYAKVVADNKVVSVNSSFGACETNDIALAETSDQIAEQGAALGITFHAASGDEGAFSCIGVNPGPSGGTAVRGVIAPASSPHFVAIGGTTLHLEKSGTYEAEQGWSFAAGIDGAGGGGVSELFPLPPWQRHIAHVIPGGRNVPDVALDADPLTGFSLYVVGTWDTVYDPIGGTSLASPLFGAAVAQIDQVTGHRLGLAAETLYSLWDSDGYEKAGNVYFHDITSGSNGYYRCGRGYDQVTGIGSLSVWNIAQTLKTR